MNVTVTGDADTLLYCGCTALASSPSLIGAAGRILTAAGIPFKVLQSEPCCGWPFYQLGDLESAKKFSVALSAAIRAADVRTVLVLDADRYRMLLTRTSRFGGDLSESAFGPSSIPFGKALGGRSPGNPFFTGRYLSRSVRLCTLLR